MVFPRQSEEGSNCFVETMEGCLQLFFFFFLMILLLPGVRQLSICLSYGQGKVGMALYMAR